MKAFRHSLYSALAAAVLVGTGLASLAAEPGSEPSLLAMTFNLRYASSNRPNAWPDRRPVMRDCIQSVAPDVMGTQEGLYQQLKDLASDLPGYAWIGTGRDGGSHGEFMAIFYRTNRLDPLEFDHFWLSDTPNVVGSTTWGNRNRRMVTWVRFLDRKANRQFYFVNTHLDHEIQPAREKAAALIRERVSALNTNLPIVLVGDFNAAAGTNRAYHILTEDGFFRDTWNMARERRNESLGTFHNFQGPRPGPRIDWILTRGPVAVESTEIVDFSEQGQYPSDHLPVIARLTWILGPTAKASAAALMTHTDVFVSGQGGYHTYRIPALETAADGSLIAFAEARKYNAADPGMGKQDIDLVYKRSTDHGATWSEMIVLEDPGELWSAANPATLLDRSNGRLWVFYLRARPGRSTETSRPGTDDFQTLARWSDDHGRSWSEPRDLTAVGRDMEDTSWRASVPGPGGPILTRAGRMIVPMWKFPFAVFTLYSDDHGATWERSQTVPLPQKGDENQVVELADGRILMDIRQNSGANRWFAESRDGGKTWGGPRPGIKVTPVACAIERFTLKAAAGDRDCLIWTGPAGPDRTRLTVRVSDDEGQSFDRERRISDGYAAYSDLAILRDQTIGVLWERGQERGYQFITFTRLNQDGLESGASRANGGAAKVISRGAASGSYQAFTDVCRLRSGDLFCVFYAGYGHVSLPRPDCPKGGRICYVRSSDEGRTWSAPRVLFDGPFDDRDPHVAQMRDGTVACSFFTYRPQAGGTTLCDTSLITSTDAGQTWPAEARIVAEGWPSSAPVRELPDGTRILGVYREDDGTAYGGVIRSTDAGTTWSAPIPIGKGSGVRLDAETDVVLLRDGTLFAALRGDRGVSMHWATSPDEGLSWSGVKSFGFPGHCPHLTRLSGGDILLTHRLPATALHISRDDAKTWEGPIQIDETPGAYASTVELKDGSVLVVYYEEGEGSAVRARRFQVKAKGIEFLSWN